jgi:hypothetical protein
MSASYLDVPVFAGQCMEAVDSLQAHEQALHDATSPSGALLLSSCFDTFHQELSELSFHYLGSTVLILALRRYYFIAPAAFRQFHHIEHQIIYVSVLALSGIRGELE